MHIIVLQEHKRFLLRFYDHQVCSATGHLRSKADNSDQGRYSTFYNASPKVIIPPWLLVRIRLCKELVIPMV